MWTLPAVGKVDDEFLRAQRLGNAINAISGRYTYCNVRPTPEESKELRHAWRCTLPPGHDGPHAAHSKGTGQLLVEPWGGNVHPGLRMEDRRVLQGSHT